MEMGWSPWKWGRSHGNGGDPDPGSVPQPGSSSGDPGTAAPSWWSREWASSGRRCRQVRGGGDTGGGPQWRFPDPGDPPGCPLRGSVGDTGGVCPLTPQKVLLQGSPCHHPIVSPPSPVPNILVQNPFFPRENAALCPRGWVSRDGGVSLRTATVSLSPPPAGDRYIVADCGGGTVDLTVHQIEKPQGTLKELYKASGGMKIPIPSFFPPLWDPPGTPKPELGP